VKEKLLEITIIKKIREIRQWIWEACIDISGFNWYGFLESS